MRKALVIGIDHYDKISPLYGCVNDAYSVKSVLERHSDGSVNFAVKLMTATGPTKPINRKEIKQAAEQLFEGDSDVALFYFAGHGYIESVGGFLCGSDCETGDDGFSLHELIHIAPRFYVST
ncbi:caspase family protein, partial [Klebsiella pneumoniae]